MNLTPYTIQVEKTARYFMAGDASLPVNEIWFVLHGYGTLADQFIRLFEPIMSPGRLFIAPEGLSRFYVDHQTRSTGASWMTSTERETDIINYLNYLIKLYNQVTGSLATKTPRITGLGFSQGVATLSRWAALTTCTFHKLIFWAGTPAPEIAYCNSDTFKKAKLIFCFGDKDQIVDKAKQEAQIDMMHKAGLQFDLVHYTKGHQIDSKLLKELGRDE